MLLSAAVGRLLLGAGLASQVSAQFIFAYHWPNWNQARPMVVADFEIHPHSDSPFYDHAEIGYVIPPGLFYAFSSNKAALEEFMKDSEKSLRTGEDHVGYYHQDITLLGAGDSNEKFMWMGWTQKWYGAGIYYTKGYPQPWLG